jgi:hypothetical protein
MMHPFARPGTPTMMFFSRIRDIELRKISPLKALVILDLIHG